MVEEERCSDYGDGGGQEEKRNSKKWGKLIFDKWNT